MTSRFVEAWLTGSTRQLGAQVWVSALFALPLAIWISIVAVRVAAATAIDGGVRRGIGVGVGVGVGAVTGLLVLDEQLYQPIRLLDGGAVEAFTLALLAIALVGLVVWAVAVAGAFLDGARRRPLLVTFPVVAICCLGVTTVAAKLCEGWRTARFGSTLVTWPGESAGVGAARLVWLVATSTSFAALAVAIVVLPVAALHRSPSGAPPWLVESAEPAVPSSGPSIKLPLVAGTVTGLVALTTFLLYDARFRSTVTSVEERESASTVIRYMLVAEYTVVVISIVGGVLVAMLTSQRSVILGMATVGLASTVGSVGILIRLLEGPPTFGWTMIVNVSGQIIPLAVVAGIAAATLFALLAGRLSHARLARVLVACGITSGLVVALLALSGAVYVPRNLPARREALSDYRDWWATNAQTIVLPLGACMDPNFGRNAVAIDGTLQALPLAHNAWETYLARTSTIDEIHRRLRDSIDACERVAVAAAREPSGVLAAQLEVQTGFFLWTNSIGQITDRLWDPLSFERQRVPNQR